MAVDLDDAKLKRDSLFFWRPARIVSMADVAALDATTEWSDIHLTDSIDPDVVDYLLSRFITRAELEH
jgi:hypothetical protein